jgi:hypothetical protein
MRPLWAFGTNGTGITGRLGFPNGHRAVGELR